MMEAFDIIVIIQGKIAELSRQLNSWELKTYYERDEVETRIDTLRDILDTIGENMNE